VDPTIFPAGGLAWMATEGSQKIHRFVLAQDEGGAIQGPGRVDFFVGDDEAEAVKLWETGRLYFIRLKPGGR
jgi:membrane-bound lytic murein transglycosylase